MDRVISELCYKGTILQRNYRKPTILWSFSYDSFAKFHNKTFESHNMTMLYPNLCYNEVCNTGSTLHVVVHVPDKELLVYISRNSFRITIRVSNSLEPNQA